jgi:hypothetical protein
MQRPEKAVLTPPSYHFWIKTDYCRPKWSKLFFIFACQIQNCKCIVDIDYVRNEEKFRSSLAQSSYNIGLHHKEKQILQQRRGIGLVSSSEQHTTYDRRAGGRQQGNFGWLPSVLLCSVPSQICLRTTYHIASLKDSPDVRVHIAH